ncbi:Type-2 restriction enzyme BglII [Candidatus Nanopelagicaceae bacterium]
MNFITHNHRFALDIVESNPELKSLWEEITASILSITDEQLIAEFSNTPTKMSISDAINRLLDAELVKRGWIAQSAIFQGEEYLEKKWRLDFSKRIQNPAKGISGMAIEVAFNHGEAIAWNLMKPVLAAEMNQVELQTEIGSGVGVYICAASDLKEAGGFDGAVGEYEKVLRYLNPMFQKLSVPLIIIGLNAPKTFRIEKTKNPITKRNIGKVVKI